MKYVKQDEHQRYAISRRIDRMILHPYLGMPIFLAIFTIVLLFVFQASAPWTTFIDYLMMFFLISFFAGICLSVSLEAFVNGFDFLFT